VHASTKRHQAKLHSTGRLNRHDVKRSLGYAGVNVRRALAGGQDSDHQRVRQYRRRLPLDGPRKVVKVRRYFRRAGSGWFTHISASGIVTRFRASR
jgi:hypothetical protein